MIRRAIGLLGIVLVATACSTYNSNYSPPSGVPRSRCLTPPQRSQDYTSDRPMVYLFCVESP